MENLEIKKITAFIEDSQFALETLFKAIDFDEGRIEQLNDVACSKNPYFDDGIN